MHLYKEKPIPAKCQETIVWRDVCCDCTRKQTGHIFIAWCCLSEKLLLGMASREAAGVRAALLCTALAGAAEELRAPRACSRARSGFKPCWWPRWRSCYTAFFNWQFSALFSSASVIYVSQLSCMLVDNKELQQWYPLIFKTFRQTKPQNSHNRMVHYTQRKFCCFTKHFSAMIKPTWLLHNNYWATEEEQRINQTARCYSKDADPI